MKTILIFYSFQGDKDTTYNVFQINNTFSATLDDFKIKHVLQIFPYQIDDKPYHFRFKTVCEEVEPKMQAWIDISNPNARVPLIGNHVYMKILVLPRFGFSKIYSKQKLTSIKSSFQQNGLVDQRASSEKDLSKVQTNQQNLRKDPQQSQKIESQRNLQNDIQKQLPKQTVNQINHVRSEPDIFHQFQNQQNQYPQQKPNFFEKEQKILNNLLDPTEFDQDDFPSDKQIQDQIKSDPFAGFSQFQQVPFQSEPQTQVPSNKNVNLWDDFAEQDVNPQQKQEIKLSHSAQDEVIDRDQIKLRNQQRVNQQVEEKVEQLKQIWSGEEQYNQWRQEAKDQLEQQIIKWAFTNGSRNQIRNLLINLHEILWEGSGWNKCSIGDLLTDGSVKKKYHDAIRIVHPDKNQVRDHRQRYIAERVFFELNQSFNAHRNLQNKN